MTSLPRGGGEDYRCSTTKWGGGSNVDVDTHSFFNVELFRYCPLSSLLHHKNLTISLQTPKLTNQLFVAQIRLRH